MVVLVLLFFSCQEKQKENHLTTSNDEYWINKWTEIEVMTHKYAAEKKWNDSINCFTISPNLDTTKIDSLLQHWSFHPEELRKTVDNLLNKK